MFGTQVRFCRSDTEMSSNGEITSGPFGFNKYLRWCAKY